MLLSVSTPGGASLGVSYGAAVSLGIGMQAAAVLGTSADAVAVDFEISTHAGASLDIDTGITVIGGEHYKGDYTITPTQSTQTLSTYGLVMDGNIKINPIPSNYGLITWNGATLTVS